MKLEKLWNPVLDRSENKQHTCIYTANNEHEGREIYREDTSFELFLHLKLLRLSGYKLIEFVYNMVNMIYIFTQVKHFGRYEIWSKLWILKINNFYAI